MGYKDMHLARLAVSAGLVAALGGMAVAPVVAVADNAAVEQGAVKDATDNNASKEQTQLPEAQNGVITLTGDTTITSFPTIDSKLTIDLAGHKLTYASENSIVLENGKSLTMRGGKGGSFVATSMKNGTTSLFNIKSASSVSIESLTMVTNGAALFPQGNAASVTVKDSKIYCGTYAVATNANGPENYDVIIKLEGSEFTTAYGYENGDGDSAPVLVNIPCTLEMNGCTINGARQGLVVRGGNATILDSTINLTETNALVPNGVAGSALYSGKDKDNYLDANWGTGNNIPMAAVVLGNRHGDYYQYPTNVKMSGVTVTASEGYKTVYAYGSGKEGCEVSCVYSNSNLGNIENPGGSKASISEAVAEVDGVPYSTVQDAVNASKSGSTVKLLDNAKECITIAAGKQLVLDLNGKTLTNLKNESGKVTNHTLTVEGNLTVADSTASASPIVSEDKSAVDYSAGAIVCEEPTVKPYARAICVQNGGQLTLKSGKLESKDSDGMFVDGSGSKAVIEGGYIHAKEYGIGVTTGASLEMKGGVVFAWNNAAIAGNGSTGQGGITVKMSGGTLLGDMSDAARQKGSIAAGIYFPNSGMLEVSGGSIFAKGGAGIVARAGSVNVTGGVISGSGTTSGHVGDSEVNVPSAGIVVDVAADYPGATNTDIVTIGGNAVVSADEGVNALEAVLSETSRKEGLYSVEGGAFSSDPSKYVAEGYVVTPVNGMFNVAKPVPPTPPSGGGGSTSDKTDVEHNQDGSTTTTVTKPDGSQTITHETATGTESVVKKDKDGNVTSTEVSVSKADAASGKVELPIEKAEPSADASKAPEVEVKVPSTVTADKPVQVTVPVAKAEDAEPNHGIVVYAVDEDGNETVLPKCAVDEDGNVVFEAAGNVTIKVVDNAKDMPDVTDADWFAGGVVDFATARGIVNGVDMPDGSKEFQGYGGTSRGMLVAMLHNLELNPEAASSESLPDVPEGAFYADAAAWALGEGILSGVDMPDGSKQFQGDAPVTREQVAVFLMRYAESLGMDTSRRADIAFPDAGEVSAFAKDAMSWAVAEGLFKGNDATHELNPTDGAARAEVAAVLMRFINLMYA